MHRWKNALCGAALLAAGLPALAGEDYEPFMGKYEGTYVSEDGDPTNNRDMSVEISEAKGGFNISWSTTTYRKDSPKTKSYSIDFIGTDREHIYQAAQKRNVFGGREPLDPMKGDAYAWARIEGPKLTVHALIVTEDGGYEMQTYDRILAQDKNLQLEFSYIRDGEIQKTINTILFRQ